ncbi:MAG TPA: nitroreductase family deazaflavin-dependent oxidoreductase [Thermomicrobiales bacterium]|nr:nitroreductase family deazaflavin-dependent oxidoreductase [Thermomicrobiales bacterium]
MDNTTAGASGRYLRPGWFVQRVMNPLMMRTGFVPTLAVRGRRSGQWRTVPVNVLELDGAHYLVAPRGTTEWVRNLRATGSGELRKRGRTNTFRAVEIPDEAKPPIIQAYLKRWGSQVKSQFDALPDPADHPVFRLESD